MLPLGPCRSAWPSPQPGVMVTSRSRLQQRALSGSVVLLHPRSMLKFMTYVTTKDQVNAWVLVLNLWYFGCLRTIPQSGHYRSEWPVLWLGTMLSSRPGLLSRAVSGWVVLMQPGSMLKWSMAHVVTEGCVSARAQVSHLSTCWWLRAML